MDINSDMGEGMSNDAELLHYISSTNIACGWHAGDPATMKQLVEQAIQKNVLIGAHPGFPDLEGFGRREMEISEEDAYNYVIYQAGALQGFANAAGTKLHHVKPHGAFYNQAAKNIQLARGIARAVKDLGREVILYGLAGSCLVDAANELISTEPPPRDKTELLRFARNRLGNTVYELHHAKLLAGDKEILNDVYWNIGPGDRIGIVGVNGAGKTTLMRTLVGQIKPKAGKLVTGITVAPAFLTQHLDELNPSWRVLEAVEDVANHIELGNGKELSASQLCERLGFTRDSQWTPVGDLSGGEKRRLQLTRLLMESPNVLLLDEPTNDFDIETLTELEDLLDSYSGTILVISHDRYFLERVCDRFVGLLGDGQLRDLPRGVSQYLEQRADMLGQDRLNESGEKKVSNAAQERQAKKDIARLDRQIEKASQKLQALIIEQGQPDVSQERLIEIDIEMEDTRKIQSLLEEEWLVATAVLEGK